MPETLKTHYPQAAESPNFPKMEEAIGAWWKEENVFRRSVERRPSQAPAHSARAMAMAGGHGNHTAGQPSASGRASQAAHVRSRPM